MIMNVVIVETFSLQRLNCGNTFKNMADDEDNEDGDEGYEDDSTEESEPKEVKGQVSLNHGNKSVNKCSVDDDSEDVGTEKNMISSEGSRCLR